MTVVDGAFDRLPSHDVNQLAAIHFQSLPILDPLGNHPMCQPFTVAGLGLGLRDDHAHVFYATCRLIDELRCH